MPGPGSDKSTLWAPPSLPSVDHDLSVLSWLESVLESQRMGLAEQHAELLQELGIRLTAMGVGPQDKQAAKPSTWSLSINSPTTHLPSTQAVPSPRPVASEPSGDGMEVDVDTDDAVVQRTAPSSIVRTRGPMRKDTSPLASPYTPAHGEPDSSRDQRKWCTVPPRVSKLVSSPSFESVFVFLIFLNSVVLAFESQYSGIDTGYKVNYPGSYRSAADKWPHASDIFFYSEWFFGLMFCFELVLKIICLQKQFCHEAANILDCIIVGSWLVFTVSPYTLPFSPMLLRLGRLGRLLRLVRLVRTVQLFDSLYLMTTAMRYSVGALIWSILLMLLLNSLVSFLLQELLKDYIVDTSEPLAARQEVYRFYGSYSRCMLTMFEITLGNWMPPCRALVENVSEWYMVFSIGHKLIIGFSCVAVLTAVFIQETFKVATKDNRIMLISRDRVRRSNAEKLQALFHWADPENTGVLSYGAFKSLVEDPDVRLWFSALELDIEDTKFLFHLLDQNETGTLTSHEFIGGIGRLKGGATTLGLHRVQIDIKKLHKQLEGLLNQTPHLQNSMQCA